MPFTVSTREATAGGRTGPVVELTGDGCRAEVWPAWGFNCLRWQVPGGDLLVAADDWDENPVPTRSGHPVLFPFPGRLRDGRLVAGGETFQLPLMDSTKKHGIHGFTPRVPWRVAATDAGADFASVQGFVQLSRDLPEAVGQWPSDFELGILYRLTATELRVSAHVENLGEKPLPWGLGFHGYFTLPGVAAADELVLTAHAGKLYEVDADNLPTGNLLDLPADLDFRSPRRVGGTKLDHVFTVDQPQFADPRQRTFAGLATADPGGPTLTVSATVGFRELVLFTPPHRRAVAVEPYTCSADAATLKAKGLDSGWRSLPPGGTWTGAVSYRYRPAGLPSGGG
jgi:aldose 1-epimerase